MPRAIALSNRHPRLRVPRAAVARAIALLDAEFKILPGDLPHLSLSLPRLQALKSQISCLTTVRTSTGLAAASNGANLKSEQSCSMLPPGELSLVFLTDSALAQIHADFMADPTATDVITFEGDPLADLAGEICISADTAAKYVGLPLAGRPGSVEGRSPDRPRLVEGSAPAEPRTGRSRALQASFATELTLYLVHGWLHLVGYDDLKPAKKRRMRAAEARALKLLQAAQAIPAFRLA